MNFFSSIGAKASRQVKNAQSFIDVANRVFNAAGAPTPAQPVASLPAAAPVNLGQVAGAAQVGAPKGDEAARAAAAAPVAPAARKNFLGLTVDQVVLGVVVSLIVAGLAWVVRRPARSAA